MDLDKFTDAVKLYNEAQCLFLKIRYDVSDDIIRFADDGAGNATMGEELRKLLNWYCRSFKPAILAHDIDFLLGEGTREDFYQANERLEKNCIRCADAKYEWYNPLRYLARHKAKVIRAVCDNFGWCSYLRAIEEMKKFLNESDNKTEK